jgi:hypothetical protein
MGEARVIAAVALGYRVPVRDVDMSVLQRTLVRGGAYLGERTITANTR